MAELQGGKFGHGFASAGITQAFSGAINGIGGKPGNGSYFSASNRLYRIAAAAAVGGTASKLSGGKFANGAMTGAFSRAFNDEVHFGSLEDKPLIQIEEAKAELSLEAGPVKLVGVDTNGEVSEPSLTLARGSTELELSGKGIKPSVKAGPLSVSHDGEVTFKACTHGAYGGACGSLSAKAGSPKVKTALQNVEKATTPYRSTFGEIKTWVYDKLCPDCYIGGSQ